MCLCEGQIPQTCGDPPHFIAGLQRRHIRPQSSMYHQPVHSTLVLARLNHQRLPEPSLFAAIKRSRTKDADDFMRLAVEHDPAVHNSAIRAEYRLPRRMAQHNHCVIARFVIAGVERAPQLHSNVEHTKIISRHCASVEPHRIAGAGERHRDR